MKTILHLIDTTGPGGAETVFVNLLKELEKTEFRNVVVLRGPGWVSDQVKNLGIQPVFLDSKGSFNLKYLSRLRELVVKESIDLIHSHLMGSNVYGALLAIVVRRPMVATFHGAVDVAAGERFLRAKFAIIGWGAASIVCVSKRLQEELSQRSPLPAAKLRLIYNGVDPSTFERGHATGLKEELALSAQARIVLSIGNIRPAKGYEYLVDAAVQMASCEPDIHFVVVGHPRESLLKDLKEKISRAEIVPNIHWLGFREDVAGLLEQADIFLLPSTSEGFSISTVEAMMAGVPVIATRSGGPEEILSHEYTGLLVPVRSPEAIVEAIERISEPGFKSQLVENARLDALRRFSLSSMLNSYKELYNRLLYSC